ncbi:hypothetical protein AB0I30_28225 [Nocardia tengchongensis]|uniref:hypothetical protein n=2 Tax=Nocardia tengchongensis TaxID=2055889 RepID=UPI0033F3ACA9
MFSRSMIRVRAVRLAVVAVTAAAVAMVSPGASALPTGSSDLPTGTSQTSAGTPPTATTSVSTPYGSIGVWMLRSDGNVANWLGQQYQGKSLYEPVNVVFVDRTSATADAATATLTNRLSAAGFPVQWLHSTGYQGRINGQLYAQQPPDGSDSAFSDATAVETNDHGRVFGPAPLAGGGFVWSAAFSREKFEVITHGYVSFAQARGNLRAALLGKGATDLGVLTLGNTYNTDTASTGDHDGNAVVLGLN